LHTEYVTRPLNVYTVAGRSIGVPGITGTHPTAVTMFISCFTLVAPRYEPVKRGGRREKRRFFAHFRHVREYLSTLTAVHHAPCVPLTLNILTPRKHGGHTCAQRAVSVLFPGLHENDTVLMFPTYVLSDPRGAFQNQIGRNQFFG
jgi:hypothetical protein